MDSWTDQQLALMKGGGNDKCNQYLESKGIDKRTPIKQKYESDAAQLYKLVLKARVEGKPEPTVLPKPAPRSGKAAAGAEASKSSTDPNGMERLPGETDQQYIARQTRLREEAKARMSAKFGGSGMGGTGSGGSRMAGIGSDPHYNPNSSSMGGSFAMDSMVTGLGSVIGSAGAMASSVQRSVLSQENMNAVKSTSASFWGSLAAGVNTVASSISSATDENDGLADLQREVAAHKPVQSKYGGFGSDNTKSTPMSSMAEAQGLPGEDRNGIARLTGETDDQYVNRQTRLRDEARARMQAKFGGSAMSSASSSASPMSPGTNGGVNTASTVTEAQGLPGEDRNGIQRLTGETDEQYVVRQTRLREEARARMQAKFGSSGVSGNMGGVGNTSSPSTTEGSPKWLSQKPTPSPSSGGINSNDFFSSFGT